jgi:UDP-glucose 4-epimerase
MRIGVTGGSGRIGGAFIELAVARGHSVVSIDRLPPADRRRRPAVTLVETDVTQYTSLEKALRGCDALVHLAAIASPGKRPDWEVHNNNVVGSYNALRAAAELGITRVCQASSVNATGLSYSRHPRYDYLPLDEAHPTYNEDPYSLSKWICEQQADSLVRKCDALTIASLRFHQVVPRRPAVRNAGLSAEADKELWGYTELEPAARACLLALTAEFTGHRVLYIVAPDTTAATPSLELHRRFFPEVPLHGDLSGNRGFFDCTEAERVLKWVHDAK